MIRKLFNQQGFSIVQGMIFAGLMAAGSLVMTRAITDLKLTQKGAEVRDDLETFHATIVSALQDSNHCTATHTYNRTNPVETQIRLANGEILAQENQIYMNSAIKVTRISVNEGVSPLGSISISYSKLKSQERLKQGFGGKDVKKILPINFVFNNSTFSRCYLDEKTYNSQTAQEFCASLGNFMQWDAASKKCVLRSHNCSSQAGTVFVGVNASGQEICQDITDAVNTQVLFDVATVNCPARSNLGLSVVGGKIVILCNPGGCIPTTACTDLLPTDCPEAPNLSNSCGVDCGTGTKSSGCAASLAWSPLTHNFGTVTVGSNSPDQTFTLTNSATYPTAGCTAPSITDTTNFTLIASGNCVGTNNIAAGGNCTVTIRANPTSTGSKATTLTRTCSTGGTASTTTNMITANGVIAVSTCPNVWVADTPSSCYEERSTWCGGKDFFEKCAVGSCGSSDGTGCTLNSTRGRDWIPWMSHMPCANYGLGSIPHCSTTPRDSWYPCVPTQDCATVRANTCSPLTGMSCMDSCNNYCGTGEKICGEPDGTICTDDTTVFMPVQCSTCQNPPMIMCGCGMNPSSKGTCGQLSDCGAWGMCY